MPNKVWKYPLENYTDRAMIVEKIFNLDIKGFDVSDAIYFTKMLLENGKVYISEEACRQIADVVDNGTEDRTIGRKRNKLSKTRNEKFNDIVKIFREQGVYTQKDNYIQSWIPRGEFTWEHVVPVSIIGTKMKNDPEFIKKYFESEDPLIDKIGHVCIVTKQEDKSLNKSYKNKMPDKIINKSIEEWTEEDVWARYSSSGIKILRLDIK